MYGLSTLIDKYSQVVDYIELRYEKVSRSYIKKVTNSDLLSLEDVHTEFTSGCFIRIISSGYEIHDSLKENDHMDGDYLDLLDSKISYLVKSLKINGNIAKANLKLFSNNVDKAIYPKKKLLIFKSLFH